MKTAVHLDPITLQFCANLARASGEALRHLDGARAHHDCGAGALIGYADSLDELAKGLGGEGGA